MCEWQFVSFVAMIIVISVILLIKVSREISKFCALALFPSKSVHLPWALPLGGCLRSLG